MFVLRKKIVGKKILGLNLIRMRAFCMPGKKKYCSIIMLQHHANTISITPSISPEGKSLRVVSPYKAFPTRPVAPWDCQRFAGYRTGAIVVGGCSGRRGERIKWVKRELSILRYYGLEYRAVVRDS